MLFILLPIIKCIPGGRRFACFSDIKCIDDNYQPLLTFPTSTALFLTMSSSGLCRQEREEISHCDHIYYFPVNIHKNTRQSIIKNDLRTRDGYPLLLNSDHIGYRYRIQKRISGGAHGLVVQARDYRTDQTVAVKVIRKDMPHIAQVERKMLSLFANLDIQYYEKGEPNIRDPGTSEEHSPAPNPHETNVVQVLDVVAYRGWQALVFPFYSATWSDIASMHPFPAHSMKLLRKFIVDMSNALLHMRRKQIIHCDIKPDNILYDVRSDTSYLADFGLAIRERESPFTPHRGTLSFQAPEFFMDSARHSYASDMWALGVTLFTICTDETFLPVHTTDQKRSWHRFLALLLMRVPTMRKFVNGKPVPRFSRLSMPRDVSGTRSYKEEMDIVRQRRFKDVDVYAYYELVDFIGACLEWDPAERMTPDQALRHPFLHPPVVTFGTAGQ